MTNRVGGGMSGCPIAERSNDKALSLRRYCLQAIREDAQILIDIEAEDWQEWCLVDRRYAERIALLDIKRCLGLLAKPGLTA